MMHFDESIEMIQNLEINNYKTKKLYLVDALGYILAEAWYQETGLPFVFARLCYNKHDKAIQKLAKSFSHTKVKIPQYILKQEAKKRGITPKQLTWYLEHIYYEMDDKAKKSLKLFLKKSKKPRHSRA